MSAIMAERIEFNGKAYYRYPESPDKTSARYFKCKGKYLHRAVWEFYNGPIPKGCHVHHKDGDFGNNALENLEVLSSGDHTRLHLTDERREWARQHADAIRPLAEAWKKDPAFHHVRSANSSKGWINRPYLPRKCKHCGGEFSSRQAGDAALYCSNNCKSAYRRSLGVDDVSRPCVVCGGTFTISRYSRTQTCSGSCTAKLRRSRRMKAV